MRGIFLLLLFSGAYAGAGELQGAVERPVEVPSQNLRMLPSSTPSSAPSPIAKKPKPCREDGQRGQNIPLFETTTPLEVKLKYDKAKFNSKPTVKASTKETDLGTSGTFSYKNEETLEDVPITLYRRGASRGNLYTCPMGQIKIEVDKAEKIFNHSRSSLKVVTQCKEEWGPAVDPAQKVLAEYALYQIMQASGIPALDTRLLKTEYQNADGTVRGQSWAIAIEDPADMAERFGSIKINTEYPPTGSRIASRMGLLLTDNFGDHMHEAHHNHEIIQRGGVTYDVPFDLDYGQLVGGYVSGEGMAISINSGLPISSQHIKSTVGSDIETANTLALMVSNKAKVYEALKKIPFEESSKYRTRIQAWVDGFYAAADEFLKEIPAPNVADLKVQPGKKPLFWFQMGCDEQKEKPVKLQVKP